MPRFVSVPTYLDNLSTPRISHFITLLLISSTIKSGNPRVNSYVPLKLYKIEKYQSWFIMLNKDLSWRPVWNSLRVKHTSNAQGYICQVSRRQRHHTLTHPDTNMPCWHRIFRKPFFNISLQPLALYWYTSIHMPPFFTSPLLFNPV